MRAFITKPVPIEQQKRFEHLAKTDVYRWVFYAYGTNDHGAPYYALYTHQDTNPLALIAISEYIITEIKHTA